MANPALKLVKAPSPKARKRSPRRSKAVRALSIPAATGGAILGGTVPLMAHTMAQASPFGLNVASLVVGACLLYSAPTVHEWAANAVGKPATPETEHDIARPAQPATWKALGFVVCLEAVLVASPVAWCSWLAMVLLMGINATVLAIKIGNRK